MNAQLLIADVAAACDKTKERFTFTCTIAEVADGIDENTTEFPSG